MSFPFAATGANGMRLAVACVFAAASLSGHAFAAEKAVKPESNAPLWSKNCSKSGDNASCVVEQFAIDSSKNMPVLRVQLDLQGGDGKGRIRLTTPLGVLLQKGVLLSLDGAPPIALSYQRCTTTGCDAVAVLDKAALEKFEKAKTLAVRYSFSDTSALDIPIKLEKLADALASLSK